LEDCPGDLTFKVQSPVFPVDLSMAVANTSSPVAARLPVFSAALLLGLGLTWLGGWPFRMLVAAAWLGLVVEISLALSGSLELPARRFLWIDLVFFALFPVAFFVSGHPLVLVGVVSSWLFVLFLFYPTNRAGLTRWLFSVVAYPYLALGIFSFFLLRRFGWEWPALAVGVVAIADTSAFLIGRAFGRRLLAPAISPAKTIEGAVCGVVLAAAFAAWFLMREAVPATVAAPAAVCLALLAVLGDLLESFFKRGLDLKDFGTVLPGHGGLFDRLDSLIPVAIGLLMFLKLAP